LGKNFGLQRGRAGCGAFWETIMHTSLTKLRADVGRLGVDFEEWNGESTYNDMLPAIVADLINRGIAHESDGATIVPVGDDVPPLLLLKSDGAYLYATTDIATVVDRVKRGANRSIYIVDARQSLHFDQLFRAVRKAGLAPDSVQLNHYGFGTVNGPDGRPFKTRSGGVMKLADLIDEAVAAAHRTMEANGGRERFNDEEFANVAEVVGIAALKFGDLITHRASDYIFDLERFTALEGKTGPYLLYTAVRVRSIASKITDTQPAWNGSLHLAERAMLLVADQFATAVTEAYEQVTPHTLAEYLYRLAQAYNSFYAQCSVLHAPDEASRASWLASSLVVGKILETGCGLLGIKVPEAM